MPHFLEFPANLTRVTDKEKMLIADSENVVNNVCLKIAHTLYVRGEASCDGCECPECGINKNELFNPVATAFFKKP